MFNLINELTESKLLPSKSHLRKYNAREVADAIFLYFLAMQILKLDFDYETKMADYARRTAAHDSFDSFWPSSTDLYILIHTLAGKNNVESFQKLSDEKANEQFMKRLNIHIGPILQYLHSTANGKVNVDLDRRFLIDLESKLVIQTSNYKSMRRLIQEWEDLAQNEKQLVMTRLLQAFRANYPKSELLPYLEKLSNRKGLELQDVCNAETGENCTIKPKSHGSFWKGAAIGAIGTFAASKLLKKDKKV